MVRAKTDFKGRVRDKSSAVWLPPGEPVQSLKASKVNSQAGPKLVTPICPSYDVYIGYLLVITSHILYQSRPVKVLAKIHMT